MWSPFLIAIAHTRFPKDIAGPGGGGSNPRKVFLPPDLDAGVKYLRRIVNRSAVCEGLI